MAVLIQIHSMVRWLVLAGLISSVIGSVPAWARPERSLRVAAVASVLLDVQVALGFVLWFGSEAWSSGAFFAVVHPLAMVAALGVMHAFVALGRRTGDENAAARVLTGSALALVLVVAGIPWWR